LSGIIRGTGIRRTGASAFPWRLSDEGLYCGHKAKGYATEVVIIAEKLPPDNTKDDLGEAQDQQDNDKETKSRRQP